MTPLTKPFMRDEAVQETTRATLDKMNPSTTDPAALRKRARRYRYIASRLADTPTVEALLAAADEYERHAARTEAQQPPPNRLRPVG